MKKILLDVKRSSTSILLLFIVVNFLGLLFALIVFYDKQNIHKINNEDYIETKGDISYVIDSVDYNEDSISIIGWAYKMGQDIKNYDTEIVLNNITTNEFITIPTDMVIRKDVTEFFNDGFNYDCSGFSSKVLNRKLNRNDTYNIYILYRNDSHNYLIKTDGIVKIGE